MKNCINKDCDKKHYAKGFCISHYSSGHYNKTPKRIVYTAWRNMIQRCYNPNAHYYERYGGRGIKVCERWLSVSGLKNFKNDMGEKPTPKHTLERVNNDGNYSPENCIWATPTQQNFNKHLQSNNISGVAGVGWLSNRNKWRSRITINGIEHNLGLFLTKEDAVLARKKAEKSL